MAEREDMSVGKLVVTDRVEFNTAYTVAAPPVNAQVGDVAYFSNGAAGSPTLAFYDGTNWKRADDSGTTIAAS